MGPKRFIDKKNSVKFHLLHRSQRDPLAADASAPQRVLAETEPSLEHGAEQQLTQKQLNAKYGIYYDDEYNYLQHLKPSHKDAVVWLKDESEPKKKKRGKNGDTPADSAASAASSDSEDESGMPALQLPSSVFASAREEEVGLLNRAAPHHGLPTEAEAKLAQVMDDDYEPAEGEDELEDNFIELAGGMASDQEGGDSDEYIDLDGSDAADLDLDRFDENDPMFDHPSGVSGRPTKSVFTEYSTTSQGVLSTVEMEALNERFENFMGQYEDLEVGGLETEEISGTLNPGSDRLMAMAADFEKSKQKPTIEKDLTLQEVGEKTDDDELVYLTVYENCPKEDRMDCESILSTYSNTRNRPALIDEPPPQGKIRIGKGGLAMDDKPKLTRRALAQLDSAIRTEEDDGDDSSGCGSSDSSTGRETLVSRISTLSVRPEGELPGERRARKRELKALRRERIQEKKANRMLTRVLEERQAQSQADKKTYGQSILYS